MFCVQVVYPSSTTNATIENHSTLPTRKIFTVYILDALNDYMVFNDLFSFAI